MSDSPAPSASADPQLPTAVPPPASGLEPALPGAVSMRETVDEIESLLTSEDCGADRWPEVEPTLLAALESGDEPTRENAAGLLQWAMLPSPAAVARLADLLRHPRVRTRLSAMQTLGSMDRAGRAAWPAVAERIADRGEDEHVRLAGLRAVKGPWPGAEALVPAIVPILEDREPALEYEALKAAGTIRAAGAVRAFRFRLSSGNAVWRSLIAGRLADIGPAAAEAVPDLAARLADPAKPVKMQAARALAEIGPAAAASAFGDVAMALLGRVGRPAVPVLIGLLGGESYEGRREAADALGEIGPDAAEAVPVLKRKAVGRGHLAVRAAAALIRIGRPAGEWMGTVTLGLRDRPRELAGFSDGALKSLGPAVPEAAEALANALGHAEDWVRGSAASALGGFAPAAERVRPALTAALRDRDFRVRRAAALSLWRIENERPPVRTPAS
jgi:HEAT repeat protein